MQADHGLDDRPLVGLEIAACRPGNRPAGGPSQASMPGRRRRAGTGRSSRSGGRSSRTADRGWRRPRQGSSMRSSIGPAAPIIRDRLHRLDRDLGLSHEGSTDAKPLWRGALIVSLRAQSLAREDRVDLFDERLVQRFVGVGVIADVRGSDDPLAVEDHQRGEPLDSKARPTVLLGSSPTRPAWPAVRSIPLSAKVFSTSLRSAGISSGNMSWLSATISTSFFAPL